MNINSVVQVFAPVKKEVYTNVKISLDNNGNISNINDCFDSYAFT